MGRAPLPSGPPAVQQPTQPQAEIFFMENAQTRKRSSRRGSGNFRGRLDGSWMSDTRRSPSDRKEDTTTLALSGLIEQRPGDGSCPSHRQATKSKEPPQCKPSREGTRSSSPESRLRRAGFRSRVPQTRSSATSGDRPTGESLAVGDRAPARSPALDAGGGARSAGSGSVSPKGFNELPRVACRSTRRDVASSGLPLPEQFPAWESDRPADGGSAEAPAATIIPAPPGDSCRAVGRSSGR